MNQTKLNEIKKQAKANVARYGKRDAFLKRYREIYFIENMEQPKSLSVDERDWKLTPSPSGRNEVQGMQRLLNTSDINITVTDKGEDVKKNKIVDGLTTILKISSEGRRGRVLSDAALAAVLYGTVTMYTESYQDLLLTAKQPAKKAHIQKQMRRSPFVIRLINPEQSYPEWDEDMLIGHTWKYKLRGRQLKNRWGVEKVDDTKLYEVYDVLTPEDHVVWAEGAGDIFSGAHGLNCVPMFVSFAGGSDLFDEPEQQLHAFLYAKAKSELDKRENLVLTTIFTHINGGMLGPMLAINPDNVPQNIKVDHKGGFRYIIADAKQIDDSALLPTLYQAKNLLDELGGQSTIQKQTLGENMSSNMPFSSLSMLSQSGKLPLVDPERALEQVLTETFNHILYRIKQEGIKNELIAPTEITDTMEIDVSLKAKLPQDSVRNSQVAQGLGDLVSDKWKLGELLQVSDPDEMKMEVYKEQVTKGLLGALVNNPEIMMEAVNVALGKMQPKKEEAAPQGAPPPEGMPPEEMQPDMMSQQAPPDPAAMAAEGNMEAMPMADGVPPPMER